MTRSVDIVLLGAPMGKERVRFSRHTGRTYTPERTVSYEGRLALAAQQAMLAERRNSIFDGPVRVDLVALMPIPVSKPKKWREAALRGEIQPTKKPDWDNFAKILDALNLVVWTDDALVVHGDIQKHYSAQPALAMRVTSIEGETRIPQWVCDLIQPTGVFT